MQRNPIDLALGTDRTKAGGTDYAPAEGLPDLRHAVAKMEGVSVNSVAITAGASMGLTAALAVVAARARNATSASPTLLLPKPYYPSYVRLAELLGFAIYFYSVLSGERGIVDAVIQFRPTTLVVNTPHNPVGIALSATEICRIIGAAESIGAKVLLDTVYQPLSQENLTGGEVTSHVVRLGSFSKTLAMAGERVGYVIADSSDHGLRTEIVACHFAMALAAPTTGQQRVLAQLPYLPKRLCALRLQLAENRAIAAAALASEPALRMHPSQSGMFAWIEVMAPGLDGNSVAAACQHLTRLAVMPGGAFGASSFLRINLAAPAPVLSEAFTRLLDVVKQLQAAVHRRQRSDPALLEAIL